MRIRRIELDETLPIRQEVLWPDRPPSEIVYPEDFDPDTFHLGAFDDSDQLVGIVTLYYDTHTTWRLRGMGVWPDHQGRGVGTALVEATISALSELGATEFWCNARLAAIDFYRRLGWEIEGDEFDIPGVGGHYVMRHFVRE